MAYFQYLISILSNLTVGFHAFNYFAYFVLFLITVLSSEVLAFLILLNLVHLGLISFLFCNFSLWPRLLGGAYYFHDILWAWVLEMSKCLRTISNSWPSLVLILTLKFPGPCGNIWARRKYIWVCIFKGAFCLFCWNFLGLSYSFPVSIGTLSPLSSFLCILSKEPSFMS